MKNLTFIRLSFLILIPFTLITCQKEKANIDKAKLINEKMLEITENRSGCWFEEPDEIQCEPPTYEGCTTSTRNFYNLTGIGGTSGCEVDLTYKVLICPCCVTIYDMQITFDPSNCSTFLSGMTYWFNNGSSQYDYWLSTAIQNAHYYARDYEKSLYNPSYSDDFWMIQVSTPSCIKSCEFMVRTSCNNCCCHSYSYYYYENEVLEDLFWTSHSYAQPCYEDDCSEDPDHFPCTNHCYNLLIDPT